MFWDFEWLLKFTTKSPFFTFLFPLAGSTALFIAWISSELPEPIKTRENCNPITRWIFLVCGCSLDFFFFFRPTIGVWTVLNWLLRFDSQKSSALFVLIRVSLLCSSQRVYRQHEGQFGRGTSPLERAGSEHLWSANSIRKEGGGPALSQGEGWRGSGSRGSCSNRAIQQARNHCWTVRWPGDGRQHPAKSINYARASASIPPRRTGVAAVVQKCRRRTLRARSRRLSVDRICRRPCTGEGGHRQRPESLV